MPYHRDIETWMQVSLFFTYTVVVINFLKVFISDILIKENIPPIIALQYMYLCPNYRQLNLTVTSNYPTL